jgi:hypothetical protein
MHFMACGQQAGGHGTAHGAQPDESDLHPEPPA